MSTSPPTHGSRPTHPPSRPQPQTPCRWPSAGRPPLLDRPWPKRRPPLARRRSPRPLDRWRYHHHPSVTTPTTTTAPTTTAPATTAAPTTALATPTSTG